MGARALLLLLGALYACAANPVWMPQFLAGGSGRNIRHLPCVSRRTGEQGVCMFALSCSIANGTHLGTCIDRFYFGSCCKIEGSQNNEENTLSAFPPLATPPPLDAPLSTFQTVIGNGIEETPSTPPTKPSRPSAGPTRPTRPPAPPPSKPPPAKPTSAKPAKPTPAAPTKPTTPKPVPTAKPPTQKPLTAKPGTAKPSTSKPASKPPPTKPTAAAASSTNPPSTPSRPTVTKPKPRPPGNGTTTSPTQRPSASPSRPPTRPSSQPSPSPSRPPSRPSPSPSRPPPRPSSPRPSPPTQRPPFTTQKPYFTSAKPGAAPTKKPVASTTQAAEYVLVSSTNASTTTTSTTKRPPTAAATTTTTTSSTTTAATGLVTWTVLETGGDSAATEKVPSTVEGSSTTHITPSTTPSSTASASTLTSTSTPVSRPPSRPPSPSPTPTPTPSPSPSPTTSSSPSPTPSSSPSPAPSPTTPPSSTWEQLPDVTLPAGASTTVAEPSSGEPVKFPSEPPEGSTEATSAATQAEQNASTSATPSTSSTPAQGDISLEDAQAFLNMSDYRQVCGRRFFPESRVVGGDKATFGKWPWQISLRQWRTNTYLHKCGAALLNENWAVTAAHCVENVPPADLLLRLGEHDLSSEDEPFGHEERRVQIVASHPQFDARTFEFDLALLRFNRPINFRPNIVPVCVPEDDRSFVGETAHVTGWGRLYEDGPLPSVLQEVSVPVLNNSACEAMYRQAGYVEHIPHIFICAGWHKGGFDSCEGDSGGPMVIQREDRRWLLAGVISWGIGCAEPNQPGVYTRVSQFRDWINQILQF